MRVVAGNRHGAEQKVERAIDIQDGVAVEVRREITAEYRAERRLDPLSQVEVGVGRVGLAAGRAQWTPFFGRRLPWPMVCSFQVDGANPLSTLTMLMQSGTGQTI